MDAFLVSFFAVAMAEMGDKTQLLSLVLASRYRKPVPILLGILAAAFVGHLVAGIIGASARGFFSDRMMHILLALSFFAAAVWALIPDKVNPNDMEPRVSNAGIFTTTFLTFLVAEIGDKTQLATAALAAQFHSLAAVVIGTTLAMVAANLPSVLLSHSITSRVPIQWIRRASGGVFGVLGLYEVVLVFSA